MVRKSFTKSVRRFLYFLRTIKLHGSNLKVYIKVEYEDGNLNEGEYINKEEIKKAFKAFIEK